MDNSRDCPLSMKVLGHSFDGKHYRQVMMAVARVQHIWNRKGYLEQ